MGDLDLITAGNKLAAIPEAAGSFRGHYENGAGGQSHDPPHHIVHPVELHSIIVSLFKINPYGLIEQAALEILVLGLLGKILQPEQPGSIALVYGYLKIPRRIEKRQ